MIIDEIIPEYRKSGGMGELYSQIEVNASPERIGEILIDFTKYPDWNPFIRYIEGNLVEGGKITAYLKPSGANGMKIHPVLLKIRPFRELRWKGHFLIQGIFDGEHVFEIRAIDDQVSLFVQHEYFKGIILPILENMLKKDTIRGFHEMNKALKARAEQSTDS